MHCTIAQAADGCQAEAQDRRVAALAHGLTLQLFELATLQATGQELHRERSLTNLIDDSVRHAANRKPVREAPFKRPGGGLGLAIEQRIALLHGGALRTLPTPQGGIRLALRLPLAEAANHTTPV